MVMKKTFNVVKRFVVSCGGCNGDVGELYLCFVKSDVCSSNVLKSISRRQFEVSLNKVCDEFGGSVEFEGGKPRYLAKKVFVVDLHSNVGGCVGVKQQTK